MNNVDIRNDKRFYIDKFNYYRVFGEKAIKSYKVCTIKLKKIGMIIDGGYVPLDKTVAYNYLENRTDNKNKYEEYCIKYGKNNPDRTIDKYNRLITELEEYDPKKGVIIIDDANILLDGQHRSCILLRRYGGNHKIKVVKAYIKTNRVRYLFKIFRLKLKSKINL